MYDDEHSREEYRTRQYDLKRAREGAKNLRGARLWDTDLYEINLEGADLRDADLREAYLNHANLKGANLEGADLNTADLSHANLEGANLRRTILDNTWLTYTNLRHADLFSANGTLTKLDGADLSYANLTGVTFLQVIADATTNFSGTTLAHNILHFATRDDRIQEAVSFYDSVVYNLTLRALRAPFPIPYRRAPLPPKFDHRALHTGRVGPP